MTRRASTVWVLTGSVEPKDIRSVLSNEELYRAAVREFEMGSLEGARQFVSQFTRLEPNSERGVILRALLLEEDGQVSHATDLLEDFARKNLKSAHARSNLARLQWKAGDPKKALMSLRLSLAQEPNQERALHLFASMVEDEWSFQVCFDQLLGLGLPEKAWMPLLVAAELARANASYGQLQTALARLAQKGVLAGTLEFGRFARLLQSLPLDSQVAVWPEVRHFVPEPHKAQLDGVLFRSIESAQAPDRETWQQGRFLGGVLGDLLAPQSSATCSLSTVRLLNCSGLIPQELRGRLGRGLALQLSEILLLEYGLVSEVCMPFVGEGGLIDESKICSYEELRARTSDGVDYLCSLYISPSKDGSNFVLDTEIYGSDGAFLERLAARGPDPSLCLPEAASKIAQGTLGTRVDFEDADWRCAVSSDHALAREVVGAFLLCERGLLASRCVANPTLSLDLLAELAAESQSLADMVVLGRALQAAVEMGVPSAIEQFQLFCSVAERNPDVRDLFRR